MTKSEQLISAFSEDYFFKELVLDNLQFTPEGTTNVELADLVINLGDIILAIQLKERNDANQTNNPITETKWFNDRCKDAKKQVKKTIEYISAGKLPVFRNKRGQAVTFQSDAKVIPVIVFHNDQITEYPHVLRKHSDSGMNINCMSFFDYCEMCRVLVTPMEIIEYLEYRQNIYAEHGDIDFMILEGHDNEIVFMQPQKKESLVHQFLAEKYGIKEALKHASYVQYFRNFLHLLPERVVGGSDQLSSFYVLRFLAHMERYEIAEFWSCLEDTKKEAKQGKTGIRHSLRHEISGYVIVFVANGLVPLKKLLRIIRRKVKPKRVLEIEVRWFDEDAFGIDFLYWDDTQ